MTGDEVLGEMHFLTNLPLGTTGKGSRRTLKESPRA